MKKLTWKRVAAALLAALLIVSVAGCGSNEESSKAESSKQQTSKTESKTESKAESSTTPPTEPVPITLGVQDDPMVEDWETNYMTAQLEEELGIKLEFKMLPNDGNEMLQKIELMMVAGGSDLPAVLEVAGLNLTNAQTYGEMGMLIPLNDYADQFVRTEAHLASFATPMSMDEYWKYLTSPDGNVYGVGNAGRSPNDSVSENRLMLFMPWMDAAMKGLNMTEIKTTEDLKKVLIYFRDNDMNGNGDATDEFPLMGYKDTVMKGFCRQLMNPFIFSQEHYFFNNKGTVEFVADKDAWKEGLTFIKSLYDEKLFDTLTFTQDSTAFNSIMSSETQVIGCIARISPSNLAKTDPRREQYVQVGALEGPTGLRQLAQTPNNPSGLNASITKNAADVETAVKFLDALGSIEYFILSRYGIEGENYEKLTGADVGESIWASLGYPGEFIETNSLWGNTNNVEWHNRVFSLCDGSEFTLRTKNESVEGNYNHTVPIGKYIKKELDYVNTENAMFGLVYTAEEQEVIAEFQKTIEDYVAEAFSKFITGDLNLASDWDTYKANLKAMGLDSYLAAVQSAWTRMVG